MFSPDPAQKVFLELQRKDADATVAADVIKFLRHIGRNEVALNSSTQSVLYKWVDNTSDTPTGKSQS